MLKNLALIVGLSLTTQLAHATGTQAVTTQIVSPVTDQDLAKKIHDKISSEKKFDKVTVQVASGIVTLQGTVKTNDEKFKVEKEVRKMEGVKSVINQITVQS